MSASDEPRASERCKVCGEYYCVDLEHPVLADVLAEVARQDAEGLPTDKMNLPNDERGCVFATAACIREAIRLRTESA